MHQLLAALFSLLVALCHHTSLSARPVEAAEIAHTAANALPSVDGAVNPALILPNRYQMARSTVRLQ